MVVSGIKIINQKVLSERVTGLVFNFKNGRGLKEVVQ
jgi:hypothetical protein